jgi:hypothetical protein
MTTQSETSTTVNVNKSTDPKYKFKCQNEKCKYQHLTFNEKLIEPNKCPCTWDGKHFIKNDAAVVAKLLDNIEPTCLNVMVIRDFKQRVENKSCYARDTIIETMKKPQYKYFVTDNIYREPLFYQLIFIGFMLGLTLVLVVHHSKYGDLDSLKYNAQYAEKYRTNIMDRMDHTVVLHRRLTVEMEKTKSLFGEIIRLDEELNVSKNKTKTLTEELNAIKNKKKTFHDRINSEYISSELSHILGIGSIVAWFVNFCVIILSKLIFAPVK